MILPITLTEQAKNKINELCIANTEQFAVHLSLKGGGCAGFEYEWGTAQADELEAGDELIQCDMGNFAVSKHSVMFLIGTEIDYIKSLVGSNFEVRNPNAQSACGCGVSVNFDIDKLAQPAI